MKRRPFNPEQNFRAARLTPDESRRLVWQAANLALQSVDEVPADVPAHLGRHFTALLDEITHIEDEMRITESMDALPAGETMKLDMGRLHYVVKSRLDAQARSQAMNQLDTEDFLYPVSSTAPLADRMPAWSNDTAAQIVQQHLQAAYQQLAQS